MTRILVTGGVRSGKSAHAEALLTDRDSVVYVAPGPVPTADDPDWAQRVVRHQARRPGHWTTVESTDLSTIPRDGAVLVDCLGTWLAAQLDELGAWAPALVESPPPSVEPVETPPPLVEPVETPPPLVEPVETPPPLVEPVETSWQATFAQRLDALVTTIAAAEDIVVVTNEVGLGVVPEHASGRLFRDLLGTVNQAVAAACDEVHLVVAGRVLRM